MDRQTNGQIYIYLYIQKWDDINQNNFLDFAIIILKTVLLASSSPKDSKIVLGIKIGSWEVGFYSGITHGHTNGRTDLHLLICSKMARYKLKQFL